jgi:hypothetical protein
VCNFGQPKGGIGVRDYEQDFHDRPLVDCVRGLRRCLRGSESNRPVVVFHHIGGVALHTLWLPVDAQRHLTRHVSDFVALGIEARNIVPERVVADGERIVCPRRCTVHSLCMRGVGLITEPIESLKELPPLAFDPGNTSHRMTEPHGSLMVSAC